MFDTFTYYIGPTQDILKKVEMLYVIKNLLDYML